MSASTRFASISSVALHPEGVDKKEKAPLWGKS